jgi:hypothetical protein
VREGEGGSHLRPGQREMAVWRRLRVAGGRAVAR